MKKKEEKTEFFQYSKYSKEKKKKTTKYNTVDTIKKKEKETQLFNWQSVNCEIQNGKPGIEEDAKLEEKNPKYIWSWR